MSNQQELFPPLDDHICLVFTGFVAFRSISADNNNTASREDDDDDNNGIELMSSRALLFSIAKNKLAPGSLLT